MGIYLSKPNTTKSSQVGDGPSLKYGVSSMQGWRMTMEDSHISEPHFTDNASLFAVFDGHGGAEVAKFCSKHFPPTLKANNNFIQGNYKAALEETFLKMDEMLLSSEGPNLLREFRAEGDANNSFAGCTANVVLIVNNTLYVANAGDSRAVVYTNDNEVVALSTDHKPDLETEKQRIHNAGGYVSDGRVNDNLNLTRAIGDLEYKKNPALKPQEQIISAFPDVVEHKLNKSEKFMLIGCDGIWETLSAKDIFSIADQRIKNNPDVKLSIVVEELLDRLIAKETMEGVGCDNMSAIFVQFAQ